MPDAADHTCRASRAARARFYRRVALAPLCLCLIAGLHAYRVATLGQTPWKGGGFGMFSTVDSDAARYLRCYLVAADGTETPVVLPPELTNRGAELRVAPSEAAARELAERIARRPWTLPVANEIALATRLAKASADRPIAAATLREATDETNHPTRPLSPGMLLAAEVLGLGESLGPAVDFRTVRVEVWKYRFDEQASTLVSERVLSGEAHAPPAAGTLQVAEAKP